MAWECSCSFLSPLCICFLMVLCLCRKDLCTARKGPSMGWSTLVDSFLLMTGAEMFLSILFHSYHGLRCSCWSFSFVIFFSPHLVQKMIFAQKVTGNGVVYTLIVKVSVCQMTKVLRLRMRRRMHSLCASKLHTTLCLWFCRLKHQLTCCQLVRRLQSTKCCVIYYIHSYSYIYYVHMHIHIIYIYTYVTFCYMLSACTQTTINKLVCQISKDQDTFTRQSRTKSVVKVSWWNYLC